jgi:hypothetical protein
MDVKLIVVSAKTGTKEIVVKRPRIVGRARGIGIVIPHPAVSGRHCLLFDHNGLLMVQDLNSEHGTLVGARKIVMAPLPPNAEFTVGPLTFRAEYAYSGNLDDLPKTLFLETEAVPAAAEPASGGVSAVQPHNEPTARPTGGDAVDTSPNALHRADAGAKQPETGDTAITAGTIPANGAPAEFPSFFGLENNASYPVVVPPTQQSQAVQQAIAPQSSPSAHQRPHVQTPLTPAGAESQASRPHPEKVPDNAKKAARKPVEKAPPPLPPPAPQTAHEPGREFAPVPDFGAFADGTSATDGEPLAPVQESETGIPGFVVASVLPQHQPATPEPPMKKKPSGSLLDFFSKRPPRKKRILRQPPSGAEPATDAPSNPATPATPPVAPAAKVQHIKRGAWAEEVPNVTPPSSPGAPLEPNPAPPDSVDEDLSNFFKKLK